MTDNKQQQVVAGDTEEKLPTQQPGVLLPLVEKRELQQRRKHYSALSRAQQQQQGQQH